MWAGWECGWVTEILGQTCLSVDLREWMADMADWVESSRRRNCQTLPLSDAASNIAVWSTHIHTPVLFAMTVRAGTAYRKIWRLVNNFFCSHNKVHCSKIPIVLSNLLYHYFFHWIMAHFNFVISQNAKWRHAGFYIDCHQMTVPENILLQKKHCHTLNFINSSNFKNFEFQHLVVWQNG